MCDEYLEVGRAAGEELWLTRSGKVIEGQFEVQVEECIVDSGASASTSHTARGENKHVFAGDVVTAFLHADTTPEERVVITASL